MVAAESTGREKQLAEDDQMTSIRLLAVALLAATAIPALPAAAQTAPAKKPVNGVDDMPRYTYPMSGKVEAILTDEAAMKALAGKVKADIGKTLAGYDIQDRATLRGLHRTLRMIALIEGDWDAVKREAEAARSLQDKAADKLISGNIELAMVAAKDAGAFGTPAQRAAFKQAYATRIDPLPWDVVGTDLTQSVNTLDGWTAAQMTGSAMSAFQPSIDKGGSLSFEEASGLVAISALSRFYLPLKAEFGAVEGAYVKAHRVVKPSIWTARDVVLPAGDKTLSPVVVGIWDSGMDTALFPGLLWTNGKETMNGKDDDGNGFVDDVHGIGFDDHGRREATLLRQPHGRIDAKRIAFMADIRKGFGDQAAGIDSSEAREQAAWMNAASPEDAKALNEDMQFYGSYAHGTHVAGIVAAGDPYVRLVGARYNFATDNPPRRPTPQIMAALGKVHQDIVDYFKKAGVRVVNMSWGIDIKTEYESQLLANGVPPEQAASEARELFAIETGALRKALESAPEILFICAAGNSNNSASFVGFVPSGWDLPNLITTAAVDQAGDPTSFTTTGPTIDIAANGYQVDSVIPGGKRALFSGTSMASPQVVNAAAKVMATNPKLTGAQVRAILLETATPSPSGLKLLDTKAAVAKAKG